MRRYSKKRKCWLIAKSDHTFFLCRQIIIPAHCHKMKRLFHTAERFEHILINAVEVFVKIIFTVILPLCNRMFDIIYHELCDGIVVQVFLIQNSMVIMFLLL